MPDPSDPRAPIDYLALASAWRCPTCGHSLADQIGHCGDSEGHLEARTQPAARAWLIGRLGPEDGWAVAPPPARRIGRAPYPPSPDWLRATLAEIGIGRAKTARLLGLADDRLLRRWLAGQAPIPWASCELLAAWADGRPPELKPEERGVGLAAPQSEPTP